MGSSVKYEIEAPDAGTKYEIEAPIEAPAGTPPLTTAGNAAKPQMNRTGLLSGHEYKPGTVGESVGNAMDSVAGVAKGAAKSLADVSAPIIAHRQAQKHGAAKPGDLYEGEVQGGDPQFNAIMAQGVLMTAPEVAETGGAGKVDPATPRGRTVPKPPNGDLPPEQVEAIDKANRTYQGAKSQIEKREGLQQASKSMVQKTYDNLHTTHDAARGALDQQWGAFRQGMEGAQLEPTQTFNNIEEAKGKYLKGSPASLKVFNDLAREMGIQEFMEGNGGELKAIPGSGELPFDTARIHYSAISDKLAQGGLPGNVWQALKAVKEGLDKQLSDAAETRGLGKQYQSLKANESQFRTDWTDPKSPLARAYKSLSPDFLEQHLTNPAKGEYISSQLKRYTEHGAQPHLPLAARRFAESAREITKKLPEVKELPKPKASAKGGMAKKMARVGGKVVGGTVGSAVGHPFLGYAIGGEAGSELYDRATRPKTVPPPPDE